MEGIQFSSYSSAHILSKYSQLHPELPFHSTSSCWREDPVPRVRREVLSPFFWVEDFVEGKEDACAGIILTGSNTTKSCSLLSPSTCRFSEDRIRRKEAVWLVLIYEIMNSVSQCSLESFKNLKHILVRYTLIKYFKHL